VLGEAEDVIGQLVWDMQRGELRIWHPGRSRYWILFWSTLLRSPRKLHAAVELSILGHHYRKVASSL
jgi:hypothetical protein